MFICRKNSIITTEALQESELIQNVDGSIYHLSLLPEDIAPLIITVGDPNRVNSVSKHFDEIEVKKSNREFNTHTGIIGNQRITCISTGIGTDNIDIVLNELDALVNIDLATRTIKTDHTSLQIVRLGTSGSINKNITVGDIVFSKIAIGLEGLFSWYHEIPSTELEKGWMDIVQKAEIPVKASVFEADQSLCATVKNHFTEGVTLTTAGFYGPQSRTLRLKPKLDLQRVVQDLRLKNQSITNIEMETAGIYGLSKLLGHQAISINAIMANRLTGKFANNPMELMDRTITKSLEILCDL